MKLWMRRIFVAIVTVVTLGMYIPPLEAHPDKDRAKDTENFVDDKYSSAVQVTEEKHDYTVTLDPVDEHLQLLLNKAKQQTQIKLGRSEERTSELQSRGHLVCRLLLEKKKKQTHTRKQRHTNDL